MCSTENHNDRGYSEKVPQPRENYIHEENNYSNQSSYSNYVPTRMYQKLITNHTSYSPKVKFRDELKNLQLARVGETEISISVSADGESLI